MSDQINPVSAEPGIRVRSESPKRPVNASGTILVPGPQSKGQTAAPVNQVPKQAVQKRMGNHPGRADVKSGHIVANSGQAVQNRRAKRGEAQQWFEAIALNHEGHDCLIWPFAIGSRGYGQLGVDGKTCEVHRLVCIAEHGAPPRPDHEAAHRCGKRACVNRAHIRWATAAVNCADKIVHGTLSRGSHHTSSRLTERAVIAIRDRKKAGCRNVDLAREFGVHKSAISLIVNRKRWRFAEVDGASA